MLHVFRLELTPLLQNCRVLVCSETRQAVVVDPAGEAPLIIGLLEREGVSCSQIWLTHSHFDHCGGVADLKAATGARLLAHRAEANFRLRAEEISLMFGLSAGLYKNCPEPDCYLEGGEELRLGKIGFTALFTPGHSPGHLCYYCQEAAKVVTGDLLFAGSVGRTDLPGGSFPQLLGSICKQLLCLPGATEVLAGHGPDTTIAAEVRNNPYLNKEL